MKILVTGASGSIGTALLSALDDRGHEVAAVARRPPAHEPHPGNERPAPGLRWTALDLRPPNSRPALYRLVRWADVVVNLAWAFQPMRQPDYLRSASVDILHQLADLVFETRTTRLVHVSSVAAYSPRSGQQRVDESWPLGGIPGATYSTLKVDAERVLATAARQTGAEHRVCVLRPCLVGQRASGGAMLRCGVPALVPGAALRAVPIVPVDRRFGLQMVHADDVAGALVRAVERPVSGAFNLAADPIVRGVDIAEALGATPVRLRQEAGRALVAAGWRAHLHPLDPGWVDMALQAPWVDCDRARDELGWEPVHHPVEVLRELVDGMTAGAGRGRGALRPRSVRDGLALAWTRGTVARRPRT